MKSDVYLRAAKLMDGKEHFSCLAICSAVGLPSRLYESCPEVKKYAAIFKPKTKLMSWGYFWGDDYLSRKQCRVLALLFMHWMSQDE